MATIEVATLLIETVISIARSFSEDNTKDELADKVKEISETVNVISNDVADIRDRIIDKPDPEKERFERARNHTSRLLNRNWDRSLLDFATEVISPLIDGAIAGIKIDIEAVVQDADTARGYRHQWFAVVLLSQKSVADNARRMYAFLEKVLAFNNMQPLARRRPPNIVVRLARGPMEGFHIDRIRQRISVRLALLSSMALGWSESYFGTVKDGENYISRKDEFLRKYVVDQEPSDALVNTLTIRILSKHYDGPLSEVYRDIIDSGLGTVRIIILSEHEWRTGTIVGEKRYTNNIRTYYDARRVKTLEVCVMNLDDWDRVNLMKAIYYEMTTSILVFRFSSIDNLRDIVVMSKDITDHFPGLTMGSEQRIVYVDTASKKDFRKVRDDIQQLVPTMRLHEPTVDDICFEQDSEHVEGEVSVAEEISMRALSKSTILSEKYHGRSEPFLRTLVRILNREIDDVEAQDESRNVMEFIGKLKGSVGTKVVVAPPDIVQIVREDPTGFGSSEGRYLLKHEFGGYQDVTRTAPSAVNAILSLSGLPEGFLKSRLLQNKWKNVVEKIIRMVNERKLFLAVYSESTTTLRRGQHEYVARITVRIVGGSKEDYLYAKMLKCCTAAVQTDNAYSGDTEQPQFKAQVAVRVLLRLSNKFFEATNCIRAAPSRISSGSLTSVPSIPSIGGSNLVTETRWSNGTSRSGRSGILR